MKPAKTQQLPFIPYGRQIITEEDIQAVVDVLHSDWLTTGPNVAQFEKAVCRFVDTSFGVAVSSGTAALHAAMYAIGIGPDDEVIVPAMTFVATANCIVYQGGRPVFCDVDSHTLLLDPEKIRQHITQRTKAIIAVDYAGQPCDYGALRKIADEYNLILVADGCHALGAKENEESVGRLADLTVFSFHPVKHITTCEGGMVMTDDAEMAEKMRLFRNHGISSDHRQREENGTWYYEMIDLGYNYRISDLQCALGSSQLQKLPRWLEQRRSIARKYDAKFASIPAVRPLAVRSDVSHAYHLYVVKLADSKQRTRVFRELRDENIGVNVHYLPVHLHPFYQDNFATFPGQCPCAEAAYGQILSLPMYPGLTADDVERVCDSLQRAVEK
ncbi:MAG: UDP-4-amino-4,6-dideoxy-N-acetyl-beta-L-altrosamine transaminase [Desulfobulbaceae bacterium]|nr:UDP-4-amino-4,6-dideoxy-N-acetyl-beta-L-altrosamine transaminase [Desulfobulbaceae bacterium]